MKKRVSEETLAKDEMKAEYDFSNMRGAATGEILQGVSRWA
ncbi:MAG: hypothetical protein Q8O19_06205 [Rectinemataceae bacterium]|nr:hypothetical protein [Rectinemataceae bacterium]